MTLTFAGIVVAILAMWRRLAVVEREVQHLRAELAEAQRAPAEPPAAAWPVAPPPVERRDEPAVVRRPVATASVPPVPRKPVPPPRPRFEMPSFEALVGGRLPVWVGGAALVLAGVFLVRLSIESGLLTPGIRTALAGLFALLLLAGGEGARRLSATRGDPRIAQVLAGAGIASAYATLYLAAALYDLVSPLAGFAVMLAITGVALGLALRHGSPTAVMALAGGFAAPLVAGFDAAGIAPLLVYLGLFVAALLWLATARDWTWLALAAGACAFGWAGFLLAAVSASEVTGVAAFIVALALGVTLALPSAGIERPWLRAAPMVAGLAQLLIAAPLLDFGPLAWGFYLVLSAAALFLAWRDRRLMPAPLAALGLVLVLIGLGLMRPEPGVSPTAAVLATLIFAVPGQWLSRQGRGWALLGVVGTAGPVLAAQLAAAPLLAPMAWCSADLLLAGACGWLSWRHRDRIDTQDIGLVGGALAAALLLWAGLQQVVPGALVALPLVAAMAALAGWSRHSGDTTLRRLTLLPLLGLLLLALIPLGQVGEAIGRSLLGEMLPYRLLPPLRDILRFLALPTAALAAILFTDRQSFGRTRNIAVAIAGVAVPLLAYLLLKQPLAIAEPPAFAAYGFIERAVLTQALLLAGWALVRSGRFPREASVLLALGVARILWFDLLLFNPAWVAQAVGALPLLNAATLHTALAAEIFWTLPPRRGIRPLAAALTLLALVATVRQATHGSVMTGPIGTGENWGYSAAMLGLSLFWLWRGIAAKAADLRLLGLLLLTATTLKVFLIDAAALEGVLRILSFLGLGFALIGIGWAYRRFLTEAGSAPPADQAPA
ncbi:DUF2339 domain-containing protein [Sphingomonas sp. PL-96]|uniref:DUF2339 domain-containing protein n=1 Tax=Sphingomonas sp. PL-96 TaxID=2887201 RepID=UPI001E5E7023|nr:DUF2339 domain-containing protein [Sphingomonas sp. PL-96]MCC2977560.1 DUF2339 domain-containing protein [Sphingomonas sp. PL-96]